MPRKKKKQVRSEGCEERFMFHSVMMLKNRSMFISKNQPEICAKHKKKSISRGHVMKHRLSTCSVKRIQLRFITQSIIKETLKLLPKCPFRRMTEVQLLMSSPSCSRSLCVPSSSSAAAPPASAASSACTPSRCQSSPYTGARSGCWPSWELLCNRRAGGEGWWQEPQLAQINRFQWSEIKKNIWIRLMNEWSRKKQMILIF